MQYYAYHIEQEPMLKQLDNEFDVVLVVGEPPDGYSDGWDLAIYDTRSKGQIARDIRKLFNEPGRKA